MRTEPTEPRTAMRNRRLALDMTQADVARAVGIYRESYANIERGAKNPSLPVMMRIAKALRTSVEGLTEHTQENNTTDGTKCQAANLSKEV